MKQTCHGSDIAYVPIVHDTVKVSAVPKGLRHIGNLGQVWRINGIKVDVFASVEGIFQRLPLNVPPVKYFNYF